MRIYLSLSLVFLLAVSVFAQLGTPKDLDTVGSLPILTDYESYLVSSYDRTGGNNDGFDGAYSFLRKEGSDLVIFEENGPGVIRRIWTPNRDNNAKISIYIDNPDKPAMVLNSFQDLFRGDVYPFISPFSDNSQMGAGYCYIPIGFTKYCKIVIHGQMQFYQITWDKYREGTSVKSFDTNFDSVYRADLKRAADIYSRLGQIPYVMSDSAQIKSKKTISGGKTETIAKINAGPGRLCALKLRISSKDIRAFRKTVLLIDTDDLKFSTVKSPVGDFFLDGFNQGISKSLLLGRDKFGYYSYIPMPFKDNINIKIENTSDLPVTVTSEIVWNKQVFTADTGYFFAYWHRDNPTEIIKPFSILKAKGRGKWLGVSHAMQAINVIADMGVGNFGYLEGDEIAKIDGRDDSSYHGTGTEDYFNGGWYFGEVGSTPFAGCGVYDFGSFRCLAYRLHITDPLPFQRAADISIEHGHNNEFISDYAGVTYWYGDENISFDNFDYESLIPSPIKTNGVTEAEENVVLSDIDIVNDLSGSLTYSNGKAVLGDNISVFFDVSCDGRYNLLGRLLGSGGVFLDDTIYCGDVSNNNFYTDKKLIDNKFMAKGKHSLTIKSKDNVVFDCYRLIDVDKPVEAENLKIINLNADMNVAVQNLADFGGSWSGNAQVFAMSKAVGDSYILKLPVKSGKINLSAVFTNAPDYGNIRIYVDNKFMCDINGFANSVIRSARQEIGIIKTDKNIVDIKIEVIGKDSLANGYYSGVDCFYINYL